MSHSKLVTVSASLITEEFKTDYVKEYLTSESKASARECQTDVVPVTAVHVVADTTHKV